MKTTRAHGLAWQVNRSLYLALVALALFCATLVGLKIVQAESDEWVRHTREISRLARDSRLLATERETALRGFLLTRNARLLEPELRARAPLASALDSLRTRTTVPEQAERAQRIIQALARWEREFATPVITGSEPELAALGTLSAEADKPLFDPIRAEFAEFLAAEETLYLGAERQRTMLLWVAAALLLLELTAVAAMLVRFRRELVGQAAQIEEQQVQLEEQAVELEQQMQELEVSHHELTEALAETEHARGAASSAHRLRQHADAFLDSALASAPVGFGFYDQSLRFIRVNRTLAAINGAAPEDHAGRTLGEVVPDVASTLEPLLRKVLDTGEAILNVELSGQTPAAAGKVRHWLASFYPVRTSLAESLGVGAVVTETTEMRELEQQLLQSQKMEAVGRLAGGVAHDFNNLLTVIRSYSELLLLDLPADDARRAEVDEIKSAADRAAALTRQLLAFSRKQVLQPRIVDLNEVVRGTERMLRRLIVEDVALATVLAPDLAFVLADPGQLEQVLVNLAVNAADAMPDGGRLTITTTNVELDSTYARRHANVEAGPYVMLAVSDTGHGMSQETIANIFEPFFTTKAPGKGTGLGLSTVYAIVKQSRGHVWVYSEVGHGTTFKVYLPRAEAAAPEQAEKPIKTDARGSETILLVEDEDSVRSAVGRILERQGYSVLEAHHGGEALRIAAEFEGPIHLVVSDLMMPEMSGREFASRLMLSRPDVKVLFMSGYTDDEVVRRGLVEGDGAFIQKPFALEELARKVRVVLRRS